MLCCERPYGKSTRSLIELIGYAVNSQRLGWREQCQVGVTVTFGAALDWLDLEAKRSHACLWGACQVDAGC